MTRSVETWRDGVENFDRRGATDNHLPRLDILLFFCGELILEEVAVGRTFDDTWTSCIRRLLTSAPDATLAYAQGLPMNKEFFSVSEREAICRRVIDVGSNWYPESGRSADARIPES